MSHESAPSAALCAPCRAAYPDVAEALDCVRHTPEVIEVARMCAASIHDHVDDEKTCWFLDDALAFVEFFGSREQWSVEYVGDRDGTVLRVNGHEFWYDPNEEGPGVPQPVPPRSTCRECSEDVGRRYLDDRDGVAEVECQGCFHVEAIPVWWTSASDRTRADDEAR